MTSRICILGAGHGGLALAEHFANLNNQVTLCADSKHLGFSQFVKNNNNTIVSINHVVGTLNTTKIYNVTNDYKVALADSDIIFIVTPSYAHESIFLGLLPYIESRHKIITLAGNFSTIIFHNLLIKHNIHTRCLLADISSLPYACRVNSSGYTVDIFGVKNQMGLAAIPAKRTLETVNLLNQFFPTKLIAYKNPIEIGLNITSGISHPISALFNAGRIGKNKESFYFYKEGISEHTAVLLEQLDADRQQIGNLYNFDLPKYTELMNQFYGNKYPTIYDFFTKTPVHNAQKLCPSSLAERYITQDVPYVIVAWYTLGKMMGFESTIMRNIIELSSMINKTNYFESGLNQDKLIFPVHISVSDFITNIESGCLKCFPKNIANF